MLKIGAHFEMFPPGAAILGVAHRGMLFGIYGNWGARFAASQRSMEQLRRDILPACRHVLACQDCHQYGELKYPTLLGYLATCVANNSDPLW